MTPPRHRPRAGGASAQPQGELKRRAERGQHFAPPMVLYGRNPVREAMRGKRAGSLGEIWATAAAARESWLRRARVTIRSAEEIERQCGSKAHQGVCVQAGDYPYVPAHALLQQPQPLLVVLDQVQDPQNLGSICRTAECAGASGVVIAERRSAQVTPAVCKASAGAVEHLAIALTRNIADFLGEARAAGCWCYGASTAPTAAAYDSPNYGGGVALVLGSEGGGLRPRVAKACDQLIELPMRGRIESLGVSAAAAALLYRILQDRPGGVDKVP